MASNINFIPPQNQSFNVYLPNNMPLVGAQPYPPLMDMFSTMHATQALCYQQMEELQKRIKVLERRNYELEETLQQIQEEILKKPHRFPAHRFPAQANGLPFETDGYLFQADEFPFQVENIKAELFHRNYALFSCDESSKLRSIEIYIKDQKYGTGIHLEYAFVYDINFSIKDYIEQMGYGDQLKVTYLPDNNVLAINVINPALPSKSFLQLLQSFEKNITYADDDITKGILQSLIHHYSTLIKVNILIKYFEED